MPFISARLTIKMSEFELLDDIAPQYKPMRYRSLHIVGWNIDKGIYRYLHHDAYTKLYRLIPALIRQGLEGEGFSLVLAKAIFSARTKFRVLHRNRFNGSSEVSYTDIYFAFLIGL